MSNQNHGMQDKFPGKRRPSPITPGEDVETAELIGGPHDGIFVTRINKEEPWPEFQDLGLGSYFPYCTASLRRRNKRRSTSAHSDYRRALYRLEPLANGKVQYQLDRRYDR